ncbi:MAG: hypothetical protein IJ358_03595, partial [Clostridia bacterium]|nr:hypothetical protein [Clostridia bacterium]
GTGDATETITLDAQVSPEVGKGESTHWMGATFKVTVTFQICQADYLNSENPGAPLDTLTKAEAAWGNIA